MSALRFALVCWLLLATVLTCTFLYIGMTATSVTLNLTVIFKHLIFSAVLCCPVLLIAFALKQRRETGTAREQSIRQTADQAVEKTINTTAAITFDYLPRSFRSVLVFIVFAFGTYAIFYGATQNDQGITWFFGITLSPATFNAFLYLIGSFTLYYSLILLATVRRSFGDKYQLSVTQDQISFPLKPYSAKATSIKMAELKQIYIRKDKYDRDPLLIKHNRGTSVLWPSGFNSEQDFQTYAALASARVEKAHQEQVTLEFFIRALEDAPADIAEALLADETPELLAQIKTHLQEQKQNTLKGTNNCHG